MLVAMCIDQLNRYSHAVAGLQNTAFENRVCVQLFCDLRQGFGRSLITGDRGARQDLKCRIPSNRGYDLLSNAIAEILLPGVTAQVLEGQHCNPVPGMSYHFVIMEVEPDRIRANQQCRQHGDTSDGFPEVRW